MFQGAGAKLYCAYLLQPTYTIVPLQKLSLTTIEAATFGARTRERQVNLFLTRTQTRSYTKQFLAWSRSSRQHGFPEASQIKITSEGREQPERRTIQQSSSLWTRFHTKTAKRSDQDDTHRGVSSHTRQLVHSEREFGVRRGMHALRPEGSCESGFGLQEVV